MLVIEYVSTYCNVLVERGCRWRGPISGVKSMWHICMFLIDKAMSGTGLLITLCKYLAMQSIWLVDILSQACQASSIKSKLIDEFVRVPADQVACTAPHNQKRELQTVKHGWQ